MANDGSQKNLTNNVVLFYVSLLEDRMGSVWWKNNDGVCGPIWKGNSNRLMHYSIIAFININISLKVIYFSEPKDLSA